MVVAVGELRVSRAIRFNSVRCDFELFKKKKKVTIFSNQSPISEKGFSCEKRKRSYE